LGIFYILQEFQWAEHVYTLHVHDSSSPFQGQVLRMVPDAVQQPLTTAFDLCQSTTYCTMALALAPPDALPAFADTRAAAKASASTAETVKMQVVAVVFGNLDLVANDATELAAVLADAL
jgi:hypothetical protein